MWEQITEWCETTQGQGEEGIPATLVGVPQGILWAYEQVPPAVISQSSRTRGSGLMASQLEIVLYELIMIPSLKPSLMNQSKPVHGPTVVFVSTFTTFSTLKKEYLEQ